MRFLQEYNSTPTTRRTSSRWSSTRKVEIKILYHIIIFSLNLPLVFIFKQHFDRFKNQPPGEPQEHHLGEVLQGRSKSNFNVILSYSIVLYFLGQVSNILFQSSGSNVPKYFNWKLLNFLSWSSCFCIHYVSSASSALLAR